MLFAYYELPQMANIFLIATATTLQADIPLYSTFNTMGTLLVKYVPQYISCSWASFQRNAYMRAISSIPRTWHSYATCIKVTAAHIAYKQVISNS